MLSKACEYGIRAILHIARCSQDGNRVDLKSIAKEIKSPEAFTAKILFKMSKAKIIDSSKGPKGGFQMSEDQRKSISISELVKAIDGEEKYNSCILGLKTCNDISPCPMHEQFKSIKSDFKNMMENTTIEKLASKLNKESTSLK